MTAVTALADRERRRRSVRKWNGSRLGYVVVCVCALAGCTDGEMSQVTSYGSQHKITVFSGGQAVKSFTSTGKVHTEHASDGWYFRDKATGKLVRVAGTVVVEEQ